MRLTVLDVGNTHTRWASFEDTRCLRVRRIRTGRPLPVPRSQPVIFSSVVPEITRRMRAAGARFFGSDFPSPFPVRVRRPGRTGTDRIAAGVAAFLRLRRACVVASFGTALTVDAIGDDGAFLGGAIAPGAGTMASALAQRTAQVPAVRIGRPRRAVGRDTSEAVRSGIWHALWGVVESVRRAHCGPLVVTGSDAPLFASRADMVAPNLVLEGVAIAYLRWIGRA
jgi:type III pantothenate kinase